jgi:hypothetical protein
LIEEGWKFLENFYRTVSLKKTMKSEGEEIFGFGHTKHQKYSIHEIGAMAV